MRALSVSRPVRDDGAAKSEKSGTGMAEQLSYKLEKFEGPLDLLLSLIEKEKIDIYDIPISQITDQYMEYMARMETEDLNIMSDFLVMAATLLDIKARMLLPAEVDEETGEEVDPRAELVERLLEHKKYKLMAQELAERAENAAQILYKDPTIPKEVQKYEPPVDLDSLFDGMTLAKLQQIFETVMKRKEDRIDPERSKFGTIKKEPVSLSQKIGTLLKFARQNRKFSFRNLLERENSKVEVVVTFLAVLELMKLGRIRTSQEKLFDDIQIETTEEEGTDEELDLSGLEDFEG
jgi:segregation and condensation protein A